MAVSLNDATELDVTVPHTKTPQLLMDKKNIDLFLKHHWYFQFLLAFKKLNQSNWTQKQSQVKKLPFVNPNWDHTSFPEGMHKGLSSEEASQKHMDRMY